jgi:hypothetical protein
MNFWDEFGKKNAKKNSPKCLKGSIFITAGQRPAAQTQHANRCLKGKGKFVGCPCGEV